MKQKPKKKAKLTEGVSRRAFARLANCDEATVRNYIKSGDLDLLPDGLLDPAEAESFSNHIHFNKLMNGTY